MLRRQGIIKALKTLDLLAGQAAATGGRKGDIAELRRTIKDLASENKCLRGETESLRQKEAHFRELFNATYDGIFLADLERERIIDANDRALRLLGYERNELSGLTVADLHPYEMPRFRDIARQLVGHGHWEGNELTCRANGAS